METPKEDGMWIAALPDLAWRLILQEVPLITQAGTTQRYQVLTSTAP